MLMGSILLDHVRASNHFHDDWAEFDGQSVAFVMAESSEVIEVRIQDSAVIPVRLLGVASFNSSWDAQGVQTLNNLLKGNSVTLRLEKTQTRDSQGRLMAFVFDEDNQPVAAELARRGVVLADRRITYQFHGLVEQAEGEAHRRRSGFWATTSNRMLPAWRAAWFRQRIGAAAR